MDGAGQLYRSMLLTVEGCIPATCLEICVIRPPKPERAVTRSELAIRSVRRGRDRSYRTLCVRPRRSASGTYSIPFVGEGLRQWMCQLLPRLQLKTSTNPSHLNDAHIITS